MSSKRVILLTKDRCFPSKSNQFYGINASKGMNNNNNEQFNSINLNKNNKSENIKFEQSKSTPFLKKSQNNNGQKNENIAVSPSNVTSKTSFDFLKQQNKELMNPGIIQFKTSQKLSNFSRLTPILSKLSNVCQLRIVPSKNVFLQRSLATSAAIMLSQKVLNIVYSRGTSATSLRYNSVYTLPKRFYKNVTVSGEENNGETLYSIQLDNKNLKTLAGKVLKVNSEPLALAVAQEWDAQKDFIHKSHMLLTGLSFTAMDNPFEDTKETLTSKIMEFFDTDTLLYFDGEAQNLEKMQNERWGAIIKWANDTHGLNLRATNNLSESPQVTDQCRENVKRWLLSNNIWALNGLNYGTEAGKSILIMMALVAARITATEAAELSRLEQMYQAKIWGNVEWSHDIEHQTLCSRLSASALFYYFTSNFDVKKEISSSATA